MTDSLLPKNQHRIPKRVYVVATVLLIAAGLVSSGDVPISQFLVRWDLPSDLRKLVSLSEAFSHGMGVAAILIVLAITDAKNRQKIWRIAACPIAAGLASNLVKMFVARYRPQYFYQQITDDQALEVPSTLQGWLPIIQSEDWRNHLIQSFPSAHTTVAFAFAVGLGWAYPRGKYAFFTLAFLAGLQRIESQSHWPSDVAAGAALGLLAGSVVCYSKLGNAVFSRLDSPKLTDQLPVDQEPTHASS